MNFNLLRQLVKNGITPEYRTFNPSRRATRSWVLDINNLILENDEIAYTEIEEGRITPFFAKGAPRNINSYFPGSTLDTRETLLLDNKAVLGRKSVVTSTGRKYTVLYNANTNLGAVQIPGGQLTPGVGQMPDGQLNLDAGQLAGDTIRPIFLEGYPVLPWNKLATFLSGANGGDIDAPAYINPNLVQSIRLREKVNIEIEGKKLPVQRVTVIFKKEVNYSVDIAVLEDALASTISALVFGQALAFAR